MFGACASSGGDGDAAGSGGRRGNSGTPRGVRRVVGDSGNIPRLWEEVGRGGGRGDGGPIPLGFGSEDSWSSSGGDASTSSPASFSSSFTPFSSDSSASLAGGKAGIDGPGEATEGRAGWERPEEAEGTGDPVLFFARAFS